MHSRHLNRFLGITICFFFSPTCPAAPDSADQVIGTSEDPTQQYPLGGEDCERNDGPSLLIEPRAHLRAATGYSDLEGSELAHGGHDPAHNGFSIPSLSLGADILYGEHVAGFTEGIISWNEDDGWNAELEEFYLKLLNLPGGIDMKIGRLLTAVGTQNNIHNHAWRFVDNSLGNVRFLGEDALATEGVEVTWMLPSRWDDRLILSFGNAVTHEHEEEAGGMGHGHSEEAEMALWDQDVLAARYVATIWPTDTYKFVYGASYIQGKNFFGKTARLCGADLTYTWLQDEDHGKQFIWSNEAMLRKVDTDEGDFEEWRILFVIE